MKKLLSLLTGLFLVFVVTGSASALTFSDVVDFSGSLGRTYATVWDTSWGTQTDFQYTHTVDFDPAAASVDSASLSMRTFGANNLGRYEAWFVFGDSSSYIGELLGGNYWYTNTFTLDSSLLAGVTGNEWSLEVRFVEGTRGVENMYIDWSSLSGEYSPVPEPATMLLFGLGILGLAGVSRKKLNK